MRIRFGDVEVLRGEVGIQEILEVNTLGQGIV